jgi:hypothetical protein
MSHRPAGPYYEMADALGYVLELRCVPKKPGLDLTWELRLYSETKRWLFKDDDVHRVKARALQEMLK